MTYAQRAVAIALAIAADNRKGYVWGGWGPNGYDCAHLIIAAYQQAGLPVRSAGASHTGNMRAAFLTCGARDVTRQVNLATGAGMQPGDVLVNQASHAAMFIGNGRIVQARSDFDGMPGDSSGREIAVGPYYNWSPGGWDFVLRPPAGTAAGASSAAQNAKSAPASTGSTPGAYTVTVRTGDTLGAIAARHGTTVAQLATLNGIKNPDVIHVGQVLRLPSDGDPAPATGQAQLIPPVPDVGQSVETTPGGSTEAAPVERTYTIRKGDSLWSIARRLLGDGARCGEIAKINNITNANRIYPGQLLRIPEA